MSAAPVISAELAASIVSTGTGAYYEVLHRGLTVREQIAGMALQGYIASFAGVSQTRMTPADVAAVAVEFADALIAELAKGGGA